MPKVIYGRDDSLEEFSSHSYLWKNILIDPGSFAHQEALSGLSPKFIIATHEHWDHIAAADFFPNVPKYAHLEALEALNTPLPAIIRPTGHGDEHTSQFAAIPANLGLEIIWTPGHTRGSMCLYEPVARILFAGDTVFADGGVGRIFYTGNREDYLESLATLVTLAEERGVAMICPGHGDFVEGEEECLRSLRLSLKNLEF